MLPRPSLPSDPSEGAGDLARLLSTEGRLEDTLRRAREEAAGLVAGAREAAAAREAALAADLAALGRGLETTIADERHRQEQELTESAQQEARAYDETGPDRIEALARYVVERVIGAES
jgi:hypothetical protein